MEKKVLRLDSPVVTRKVPMTERGNDVLRAVRKSLEDEYMKRHGESVDIPFPTVIHLALEKVAKLEGIPIGKRNTKVSS